MRRILIIDEVQGVCQLAQVVLESAGYEVRLTASKADGLRQMREGSFHLVVLSLREWMVGDFLLAGLYENNPLENVLVITGENSLPAATTATEAFQRIRRIACPFSASTVLGAARSLLALIADDD